PTTPLRTTEHLQSVSSAPLVMKQSKSSSFAALGMTNRRHCHSEDNALPSEEPASSSSLASLGMTKWRSSSLACARDDSRRQGTSYVFAWSRSLKASVSWECRGTVENA